MIDILIKYFFIFFCSNYVYSKLFNIPYNYKYIIYHLSFSVLSSVFIVFFREKLSYLTLLTVALFLSIHLLIIYRFSLKKTITFTIISLGISYISFTIVTLPIGALCYLIFSKLNIINIYYQSYLIIGIFQFCLICFIFRIKRLKKSFILYETKVNYDLGVLISVSLLLIASLFSSQSYPITVGIIILVFLLIISFALAVWWKRHITNIYIEKVYKRNVEILENSLAEQQEINRKLKHSNEELSMIIHRDNKLIPAMESAVEEILACNAPNEQKEKSKALLSQLKAMSSERSTILTDYENLHKSLVQTGIFSIDASLKYLFSRANKDGISFDLSVTCDMRKAVNGLISENDLNTLILDLGENALIAVREAKKKNILVVFGTENESFIISVYDSGIPFEKKVIDNLGKRRITTHKKTGGSGIGLMTAARLLRKHNASFVIDENVDSDSYSKRVSVIFDGLSQCRIITATNKFTRPM